VIVVVFAMRLLAFLAPTVGGPAEHAGSGLLGTLPASLRRPAPAGFLAPCGSEACANIGPVLALASSSLRRAPLLAGLVLGAVVLSSCAGNANPTGSATTTTSPVGTRDITYYPYTPIGTVVPELTVTRTVSGTCVSPGIAGASSYRCFAQPGSTIYDPCFAAPHATGGPLVCVADPSTTVAVTFDTATLPTAAAGGPTTRLWAMRLSNGQTCVLVDGAWAGLGPFACPSPGSGPPEADCHTPTSGSSWWTALCQRTEADSAPFESLRVETVWHS
jgi:hypothetical protein